MSETDAFSPGGPELDSGSSLAEASAPPNAGGGRWAEPPKVILVTVALCVMIGCSGEGSSSPPPSKQQREFQKVRIGFNWTGQEAPPPSRPHLAGRRLLGADRVVGLQGRRLGRGRVQRAVVGRGRLLQLGQLRRQLGLRGGSRKGHLGSGLGAPGRGPLLGGLRRRLGLGLALLAELRELLCERGSGGEGRRGGRGGGRLVELRFAVQLGRPRLSEGGGALRRLGRTRRGARRRPLRGRGLGGVCRRLAGAVKQTSLGVQSVPFHITHLQHRVGFVRGLEKNTKKEQHG